MAEKPDRSSYYREWAAKNKDKMRENSRRYKDRHPERFRESRRRISAKQNEKRKAKARTPEGMAAEAKYAKKRKEWFVANRGKMNANRERWKFKNPEKYKQVSSASCKKWHQAHPEYGTHAASVRRARERAVTVGDPTETLAFYKSVKEADVVVCHWCGREIPKGRRTVDHLVALSKGGLHTVSNFVASCKSCNCTKHTKSPEEFAAYLEKRTATHPLPARVRT